jgi:glycosyltransferase involved in cell wall biosynthesis
LRRVLIICGTFPPQSDVGGLRPAMMAKYLPEFGWKPYVLTREYGRDHFCRNEKMPLEGMPAADSIIRVEVPAWREQEYILQRGRLGQLRDFFQIERAHPPGVCEIMYRTALARVGRYRVQAIWATAPDCGPLRVGRDLAWHLAIPWIADFRDIPEQEAGMPRPWREHLLARRTIWRRSQLVSSAALLTSVSPHHCRVLRNRLKKPCELLYNGFDETLFTPSPACRTDRFRVVYTGRILSQWYQNPELAFRALDELILARTIDPAKLEVAFYGTDEGVLKDIMTPYHCARCVRLHSRIPYPDVPRVLAQASILLLLTNVGREGILTTKLFEYLAARRPILCVSAHPRDDIPVLLRQTNCGLGTCSLEEAKHFLLHAYRQWSKKGCVSVAPNDDRIAGFSRRDQAKGLAHLLEEITRKPAHDCLRAPFNGWAGAMDGGRPSVADSPSVVGE